MSPSSTREFRAGEILDRYRLDRLVAQSGMASIFRATDTRTGAQVAIKFPKHSATNDRSSVDHLRHETRITRKLNHPGIVKVIANDGGQDAYLVMEWLDGCSLRKILGECPILAPERAIRISLALCDTLAHVHDCGVAHCDLKPENVIVDSEDDIKLIDFGIATDLKAKWWKQRRTGAESGSPDYMSPERAQGRRGDIRADIYSLGVMLFEMLTGEVPFSGIEPSTALNLRRFVDPPAVTEINPNISKLLEQAVSRAMARGKVNRHVDIRMLRRDLSEALSEEPVGHAVRTNREPVACDQSAA